MPKIQFIAYEIDTHDTAKLDSILRAKGVEPSEMTEERYFYQQANVLRDHLRAIQPKIERGALPIFMAPEFYFKYANGKPYSRATFFNVGEYMAAISATFPDVLWVPGTMWWSEPKSKQEAIVHNTAWIYHHGKLIHTWQKERVSGIDGLDLGPEIWDRWEVDQARILEELQNPFFLASHGMDVLHAGIEICLDHLTLQERPSYGVLRTKYGQNYADKPGVQVHLLTAAGMSTQPENVVARDGGVFLRCDGGMDAAPRSNCTVVTRSGNTAAALQEWNPTFEHRKPVYVGSDSDNRLAVYPAVDVA